MRLIHLSAFILASITLLAGCSGESGQSGEEVMDTTSTMENSITEPSLTLAWESDTTLTTNESVLFNAQSGNLYVSNISGTPTDKDDEGFISILDDEGNILQHKWVSGLDAPKGMTILNNILYVTNIDELVAIDMENGTITNTYPVEGATFLNDVATDGNVVYFSDSQTGKIHKFSDGEVSLYGEGFEGANGLAVHNGNLYVLDKNGLHNIADPANPQTINSDVTGGDGLIFIDDETILASRWQGEVYLIRNGEETLLLDSKDSLNTADIGYIPGRQLVLVPRFFGNKVSAYTLEY
jgi:hypothetical protein